MIATRPLTNSTSGDLCKNISSCTKESDFFFERQSELRSPISFLGLLDLILHRFYRLQPKHLGLSYLSAINFLFTISAIG